MFLKRSMEKITEPDKFRKEMDCKLESERETLQGRGARFLATYQWNMAYNYLNNHILIYW